MEDNVWKFAPNSITRDEFDDKAMAGEPDIGIGNREFVGTFEFACSTTACNAFCIIATKACMSKFGGKAGSGGGGGGATC